MGETLTLISNSALYWNDMNSECACIERAVYLEGARGTPFVRVLFLCASMGARTKMIVGTFVTLFGGTQDRHWCQRTGIFIAD